MSILEHSVRSFQCLHFGGHTDILTGDRKFQVCDNIPDEPFLLVVPIALRAQWEVELHRYLQHGALEVLVYDTAAQKMKNFWSSIYNLSKLPPGKRIVLATSTVRERLNCT